MKVAERLSQLLDQATAYNGTRSDWEAYAEELERHVVLTSHALVEAGDAEDTEWTGEAKELFREAFVEDEHAHCVQLTRYGGTDLIAVEAHGQAPDPNRHRQGLRPERLAMLYALDNAGIPVLLAFYHGHWEVAWLRDLGEYEVIAHPKDGDRDRARYGWPAGVTTGKFRHVDRLPDFEEDIPPKPESDRLVEVL